MSSMGKEKGRVRTMSSIPDNFEVNIAKKRRPGDEYGVHFCKIQLPESFEKDAEEKLNFLRELFGEEYVVTMIHWKCRGEVKKEWE